MSFEAAHSHSNLEGWEHGAAAADLLIPGNDEMATSLAAHSATARTGVASLQVNPSASVSYQEFPIGFQTNGQISNNDLDYIGARFYAQVLFNGMTGSEQRIFFALSDGLGIAVNPLYWLTVDINNKILLVDGGGTLAGPSSSAINSGGGWTRVEVMLSPTEIEVWIDGVQELSAVGAFQDIDSGHFGDKTTPHSHVVVMLIDDFVIESSNSGTKINLPGPGAIELMIQDSDVVDGNWRNEAASPTNIYQSIDEVATDEDTTYVRTTTAGDAFRVGFETAASAGISGVISAVKVQTRARNETTSPNLATRVRSTAATDVDTANQNFLTTYASIQSAIFTSPPGASGDWATADLDALEVGGKIGSNVATAARITRQSVQVDFNTGTPPATHRAKINPETIGGKLELVAGDVVGG